MFTKAISKEVTTHLHSMLRGAEPLPEIPVSPYKLSGERTNIKVVLRYHNTRSLGGCNLSSQSLTFRAHWIAFS